MASYSVNKRAVTRARSLIKAHQYVLNSDWGDAQPTAADETKARYASVYGDLRRLHREGRIACVYRASEWRRKEIELAAHDLLQLVNKASA
jgi:hypothetical protein